MCSINEYTKEEVAVITETVNIATNITVRRLGKGTLHGPAIFSRLMERGCTLLDRYEEEPLPGCGKSPLSLRNYLLEGLKLEGLSLCRELRVQKRNMEAWMSDEDIARFPGTNEWEQRYANEDLVAAVRQVVTTLSKDELRLAECLVEDAVVAHAESKLGWTHGKTTRTLEKLKDKFRKFANYRTFRRAECKYTFEATC